MDFEREVEKSVNIIHVDTWLWNVGESGFMIYYVRIVDLEKYWWLQYSNYPWTFDFSTTNGNKSGSFLIDDEDVVVDGGVVVDGDVVNDSVVVD